MNLWLRFGRLQLPGHQPMTPLRRVKGVRLSSRIQMLNDLSMYLATLPPEVGYLHGPSNRVLIPGPITKNTK